VSALLSGIRSAGRRVARLAAALSLFLLLALGVGPVTGRYRVATVLSGSMTPTMPAGSVVFSTPEPRWRVAPGQVITFKAPVGSHWTETHRVIEVVSGGAEPVVRTRGDGNDAPDPWLARLNGAGPLWRARFAVPKLGYLIHALRQPVMHRLATLLAPALFLAACLAAIWRRPAATAAVAGDAGAA
jgi:signal peptidase